MPVFPAARASAGEIIPIEGVFPEDASVAATASLLAAGDLAGLAPPPPDSAYKGERGRVAVFAGSVGASGSGRPRLPVLPRGRRRVRRPLRVPRPLPERRLHARGGDGQARAGRRTPSIRDDGTHSSSARVGAGVTRAEIFAALLGFGPARRPRCRRDRLVSRARGLGFLGPTAPVILTPHPGEFAALTDIGSERALANPARFLPAAAKALNAVIVLESQVTWIASPSGELAVWDGMESGLGTAGSGDVLAGLAAGLLARRVAASRSGNRHREGRPLRRSIRRRPSPRPAPQSSPMDSPAGPLALRAGGSSQEPSSRRPRRSSGKNRPPRPLAVAR